MNCTINLLVRAQGNKLTLGQLPFPPLSYKTANCHFYFNPYPILKMAIPKWENFPTFCRFNFQNREHRPSSLFLKILNLERLLIFDINIYIRIGNENICKRSKMWIKSVYINCLLHFISTFIIFFNFRTKIPLLPQKTAIVQTPISPKNGHWLFCVMKVGMHIVSHAYTPLTKILEKSHMIKWKS